IYIYIYIYQVQSLLFERTFRLLGYIRTAIWIPHRYVYCNSVCIKNNVGLTATLKISALIAPWGVPKYLSKAC
ncbi:hypothetical protein AB205_0066610, partial [Aquarana catesbeiana]